MLVTAVFDCMVFLQGTAKANGPAAVCLDLVEANQVQLFLSEEIISEVQEVLTRPKLRKKFPALTDARVNEFLKRIREKATIVDNPPKTISLERDPKDEKYLNLAAISAASYLVSRDRDLLDLQNETNAAREQFTRACPNTQIVDPIAFLRVIYDLTPRPTPESSTEEKNRAGQ